MVQGDFVEPSPSYTLESLAEAETRLPCQFKVEVGQVVVQVCSMSYYSTHNALFNISGFILEKTSLTEWSRLSLSQVTWTKEKADGTKDQIITVHHTDGHTGRTHTYRC
jgi:hypothetical protein